VTVTVPPRGFLSRYAWLFVVLPPCASRDTAWHGNRVGPGFDREASLQHLFAGMIFLAIGGIEVDRDERLDSLRRRARTRWSLELGRRTIGASRDAGSAARPAEFARLARGLHPIGGKRRDLPSARQGQERADQLRRMEEVRFDSRREETFRLGAVRGRRSDHAQRLEVPAAEVGDRRSGVQPHGQRTRRLADRRDDRAPGGSAAAFDHLVTAARSGDVQLGKRRKGLRASSRRR
jgi:hypothetical protein